LKDASGGKKARRLLSLATADLAAQIGHIRGLSFALPGTFERRQQTPGIGRRPEQVRRLHQSRQLTSGYESHVPRASASHDNRLLPVRDLIQYAIQILP